LLFETKEKSKTFYNFDKLIFIGLNKWKLFLLLDYKKKNYDKKLHMELVNFVGKLAVVKFIM